MKIREIKYLRPDQIRAEMAKVPLAYLPVGPLEWHGPHLPYGTDPLNAETAAKLAASMTGGLVFPTLFFGAERERDDDTLDWLGFERGRYIIGMDFPANNLPSCYCSEEVFGIVAREQLRLMARMGFKLIMVISGHGASNHLNALYRLAVEFSNESPAKVLVAMPFVTGEDGVMRVGHASRIETAVMQHLYPQAVVLEKLPARPAPLKNIEHAVVDWSTFGGAPMPDRTVRPDDDPRDATAEEGRHTVELAARQIAQKVQQALSER